MQFLAAQRISFYMELPHLMAWSWKKSKRMSCSFPFKSWGSEEKSSLCHCIFSSLSILAIVFKCRILIKLKLHIVVSLNGFSFGIQKIVHDSFPSLILLQVNLGLYLHLYPSQYMQHYTVLSSASWVCHNASLSKITYYFLLSLSSQIFRAYLQVQ